MTSMQVSYIICGSVEVATIYSNSGEKVTLLDLLKMDIPVYEQKIGWFKNF